MTDDVRDYNELYSVSSDGEIREKANDKVRVPYMCPNRNKMFVSLRNTAGIVRSFAVATVVSTAFGIEKGDFSCIQHIDDDVRNCRPSNLRWISKQSKNRVKPRKTNTGEPFIVRHARTYEWNCTKKKDKETNELKKTCVNFERFEVTCGQHKEFKTLDEAIAHRDAYLAANPPILA